MNKEIMKKMGFDEELKAIENGQCPFCRMVIKVTEFRDVLSRKEFGISGLCQKCQDSVDGGN